MSYGPEDMHHCPVVLGLHLPRPECVENERRMEILRNLLYPKKDES